MSRKIFVVIALLALLGAVPALAASDIGPKALGPRLGYVSPENVDGVFGFGGMLDLGWFGPQWGFDVSLDYWSRSEGNAFGEAKLRDIILGARARYEFSPSTMSTRPYLFAGPAFHFFKASYDIPNFGSDSATDSEIGLDLGMGVDITASPKLDVFFEAGYRAVDTYGQWVVLGGLMFDLGPSAPAAAANP